MPLAIAALTALVSMRVPTTLETGLPPSSSTRLGHDLAERSRRAVDRAADGVQQTKLGQIHGRCRNILELGVCDKASHALRRTHRPLLSSQQ